MSWTLMGGNIGSGGGFSRFRAGNTVTAIGDSLTARALNVTATANTWNLYGYLAELRLVSNGSLSIPVTSVFATSGYTTAQMISPPGGGTGYHILAANTRSAYGIILAGTNDIGIGLSLTVETIIAQLQLMADTLATSGTCPIIVPILPNSNLTATGAKRRDYVNQVMRKFCRTQGYLWADPTPWLVDPTSATSANLAGVYEDALHPNVIGARIVAQAIYDAILQGPVAPYQPNMLAAGDIYDATFDVYGNKLDNGLFQGTGGTASTGTTGSVATSWTSIVANGPLTGTTCTASKVAVAAVGGFTATGSMQRMAVSGTASVAGSVDFQQTVNSGRWQVGEAIEGECAFELTTGFSSKFIGARLVIYSNGSGGLTTADGQITSGQTLLDTGATQKLFLKTPTHIIPASTTVTAFYLSLFFDTGTATATVDFRNASCRRVVA